MLPLKHLTKQDKRAVSLYFAIALLSAAGFAFGMLLTSDSYFGKKAEIEQQPSPSPTPMSHKQQ